MCHRHNYVNKWLEKEEFDCSYESLIKRWKTGHEKCPETLTHHENEKSLY